MLLALRWRPAPRLIFAALALLLPAVAVWTIAVAAAIGVFPAPADSSPAALPLPARRLVFLALTLAAPAGAALCAALGLFGGELRAGNYEVSARLALPRPPLGLVQLGGLLVLAAGVALAGAMAGHLAADCLFGGDCA